jgi:hypothetical protein
VQLGTPPKEFRVLIDTGSHVPWVDCNISGVPGLTVCHPLHPKLLFSLSYENVHSDKKQVISIAFFCFSQSQQASFDPRSSSTSSPLACSDSRCQDMVGTNDLAVCSNSSGVCEFDLHYGPGLAEYSGVIGYYLSDMVHLETVKGAGHISSTTTGPLIFG